MKLNLVGPLPMTEAEILGSFNSALHPKSQVKIIAQLCNTSIERIVDILVNNGVDRRRLPVRKNDVTAMEKEEAQPIVTDSSDAIPKKEDSPKKHSELGESIVFCLKDIQKHLAESSLELQRKIVEKEEELRLLREYYVEVSELLVISSEYSAKVESL